jgi:hypothetical protein
MAAKSASETGSPSSTIGAPVGAGATTSVIAGADTIRWGAIWLSTSAAASKLGPTMDMVGGENERTVFWAPPANRVNQRSAQLT